MEKGRGGRHEMRGGVGPMVPPETVMPPPCYRIKEGRKQDRWAGGKKEGRERGGGGSLTEIRVFISCNLLISNI